MNRAPAEATAKDQGESLDVAWTTNADVAAGEFSIWLVSADNGWYAGKIHAAADTVAPASYADSIDLDVPVGDEHPVYVYWRYATVGSGAWSIYGYSAGTVDVRRISTRSP